MSYLLFEFLFVSASLKSWRVARDKNFEALKNIHSLRMSLAFFFIFTVIYKDVPVSVWIIFRISFLCQSFLCISMIWGIENKLSWLNSIRFELTQWCVMQGMLCVFSKTVLENFFIYFQLAEFVPCKNNKLLVC